MSNPSVSVLLPVYDGARYLGESLDSVLAQSDGDFELIVCDDASRDRSWEIVCERSDPRVRRLRHEQNRGLFPTLNHLVEEARGERVRFWAQDDRMKPRCLETEARFWAAHPEIGLSYCQMDRMDTDGRIVRRAGADATPEVVPPWLAAQIAFYFGCMQGNISTVTARRSALLLAGPFAELRVSGDWEMWTRLTDRWPVGFIREPLIELRQHTGQLSRRPGIELEFLRDDRAILATLEERFPPSLRSYARDYQLRNRAVSYFHYLVRCVAQGRLGLAREVHAELERDYPVAQVALWWLVTANGRFYRLPPRYVDPSR